MFIHKHASEDGYCTTASDELSIVFYPKEEDYPGAIQLCLECQKAASTFKHYSCIR